LPSFAASRSRWGGRTMPLLEVRELIKAFGRLLALGGVDLTVRENELGERKMLAIGRAILSNPELLLAP
jgi:ABC-type molybdate transport system ATPase subunit